MTADPIRAHVKEMAKAGRGVARHQMADALRAVLKLHGPRVDPGLAWECLDWGGGSCDHDDGGCPEIEITVCVHCDGIREEYGQDESSLRTWPCDTARAIANALGVTP